MSFAVPRRLNQVAADSFSRIVLTIRGPIERADLPGLVDRMCTVLAGCRGLVVECEVTGVPADAVTVEALAILQLAAQRNGCRIQLLDAAEELIDLVALMGLSEVLTD
jgi:ABC-type transporter Mla MlaB component